MNDRTLNPTCLDITPLPEERTQEASELFEVTYTKIIIGKESLNKHQINALMSDPSAITNIIDLIIVNTYRTHQRREYLMCSHI